MTKNIIIAILTLVSVLAFIFAFVQRGEALAQEAISQELMQKAVQIEEDLMRCSTEAEQQMQMAMQAQKIAMEMANKLQLKEAAKSK
ncbi:MAG: hypothetical protein HYZ44_11690 [Bacteroidetes bacterium]|nr:hypothetical protein [Bacteroidota bacterium]